MLMLRGVLTAMGRTRRSSVLVGNSNGDCILLGPSRGVLLSRVDASGDSTAMGRLRRSCRSRGFPCYPHGRSSMHFLFWEILDPASTQRWSECCRSAQPPNGAPAPFMTHEGSETHRKPSQHHLQTRSGFHVMLPNVSSLQCQRFVELLTASVRHSCDASPEGLL